MKKIDFFVSYSYKDEAVVKGIVASLEAVGAKCWYAPRDVVGRYAKAIVGCNRAGQDISSLSVSKIRLFRNMY